MYSSVLIAIDGSPRSHGILETVGQFCDPARHQLHVLLAVDSAYALAEDHGRISAFDQSEYPAASHEQQLADMTMQQALEHLRSRGFQTEGNLVNGDPVSTIVAESRRLDCDLIVMGHRHLSRLDRMFDPSISSKVIDKAGCPVLVDARHA
ncbi:MULTISPECIES: universal stress protein [Pseudomonas]|uniref:Universal stress protein n=2 Tax=Pseudomonas TaxID=286 RepID=A0A411MNP3_9PSED|nr:MULTISPECIES: universal stress protein [Pseudomonas]MDD1016653.1 universal stress protein [Pseudomonas rubra]MDD1041005.1 universal stress protein [Pseudomonas rubra]MDD1153561.1 universal stress protein [Pseudomonas rubra]QBF28436.1 universal stress protein [Pseudomonas tructae]